jgi:hypothetical protein
MLFSLLLRRGVIPPAGSGFLTSRSSVFFYSNPHSRIAPKGWDRVYGCDNPFLAVRFFDYVGVYGFLVRVIFLKYVITITIIIIDNKYL